MSVLLTPSATRFVGPLSFAALSRHPVETDVLDLLPDGRIGHIVLADTADAIVVAPATAHWLGAMASGLAGRRGHRDVPRDVGAGRGRAGDGRRHVDAPGDANERRPAARRLRLHDRRAGLGAAGVRAVGRRAARRARCDRRRGRGGRGRSADPGGGSRRTTAARRDRPAKPTWRAVIVVVTAGGTREPIDPVRFIGNRSTGKMGVAIVEAALDAGRARHAHRRGRRGRRCRATRASTSCASSPPRTSAPRSDRAVAARGFDALVMAAAVADFSAGRTPPTPSSCASAGLTLELSSTPDLLAGGRRRAAAAIAGHGPVRRSGSPRRPARSIAPRTSSRARASTCWSPTTWPRRAPGSGRTPTA